MIITTTPTVESKKITEYKGIIVGEGSLGITGGFSKACGAALSKMEERAKEVGANAVIGVSIDYETPVGGMAAVIIASGTAVVIE